MTNSPLNQRFIPLKNAAIADFLNMYYHDVNELGNHDK